MNQTALFREPSLRFRLLWWTLFGCAFGAVEATVVVYLRHILHMPPGLDYRTFLTGQGIVFQSQSIMDLLRRNGLLQIEVAREAATLFLLFGAAWGAGRSHRERWGLFGFTFAIWDLSYYLYLALWIGFPRSLFDSDIYFLIPTASFGPVWFPVLIAMPAILVFSVRLLRPTPPPLPQVRMRTTLLDL